MYNWLGWEVGSWLGWALTAATPAKDEVSPDLTFYKQVRAQQAEEYDDKFGGR
jgi:hypothetical protein